ncbi:hypothetical protein ACQCSU_15140 [Pseudarthrobacter sp. O4]|uniref:hypothetical protein n=1 Tax=Pseudarthrobacter sp. O4 TaxID=3418417 RepID=UPI003CF9AC7E
MLLFDRVRALSIRLFLVVVLMLSLAPLAPASAAADTTTAVREVSVAPLKPAPAPTITGTAKVGYTLTAVPGAWGPVPVTLKYQWKANGVVVIGATAATFKPAAAQTGKALTVTVTGTKTGYTTTEKTSTATAATAAGSLGPVPVPTIAGKTTVGYTLTAVPGSWGPAPVTLKYQWKANGVVIAGATAATYKLATAQAGKTLTVTVTGTKTGYTSTAKTSAGTAAVTPAGPGVDVSWPQCGKPLPKGQSFAIIGVNNGLANNTNPCLATQLSWAATSTGGTGQPLVALYVNTGNPGTAGSWWPTSNAYGGKTVANPYGNCTKGSVGTACSYMYGYAKAYDDANIRGIKNPASYIWWLDVETENSWSTNKAANRADLEGMAAYFASIGAKTGLYSTGYQWAQIVGAVPTTSNLYAQRSWLAGASSLSNASSMCSAAPLTGGGKVTMTQYISGGFDYNKSCI